MLTRINTETDVLVDLPPGKLSKTGMRKPVKAQTSISCVLYALRRISFFSADSRNNTLYQIFRQVKHALTHFSGDYSPLNSLGLSACNVLNIDFKSECLLSELFWRSYRTAQYTSCYTMISTPAEFATQLSAQNKWAILYGILVAKAFSPLFSIQASRWEPLQGFEGLMASLRTHGAHVFIGKFGFCYHAQAPIEHEEESQHTPGRKVYYFAKNSFIGDRTSWLHAVVVDQAKILGARQMVFFRDPYNVSSSSQEEKVYMLSYESFLERLTEYSSYYKPTTSPQYGFVSQNPLHLARR